MLKQLNLKFFRQHESLEVNFTNGLNVLRGPNESGKSTLLEAVLYALGGAKALRDSLSETVTWGHKESELGVGLVMEKQGVTYTFTRSKAGAECNWPGGKVTGQAEVTSFAAELIGGDIKTASSLMLSSQSGLRGALDDGPTAVSALMGKLADFDLIDRVVESAQSSLLLGSEAPVREKLARTVADIAVAKERAPRESVWLGLAKQYEAASAQLRARQADLEGQHLPRFQKAEKALNDAQEHNNSLEVSETRLAEAVQALERENAARKAAEALAVRVPAETLAAARKRVETAKRAHEIRAAYDAVKALPAYPDEFWDEPQESFEAETARLIKAQADAQSRVSSLRSEIMTLGRNRITGGKCPTCGHDAGNDEHVRLANEETQRQIDAAAARLKEAESSAASVAFALESMAAVKRRALPFENAANRYAEWVTVDRSHYPWRVTWSGEVPTGEAVSTAQAALDELTCKDSEAAKNQGRVELHGQRIVELETSISSLREGLKGRQKIDLQPLSQEYINASAVYSSVAEEVAGLQANQTNLAVQRDHAKAAFDQSQQAISILEERLVEYQRDLEQLAFNNDLVKKLRGLKPAITDSLWNTVLSAVSNYFSTLRGEKSVVTKAASGFQVNGRSVESLSGSTLDVLALAIRVALTKTFVPHATFIVLDEPAHGCDAVRTGNVLGFLASVGFTQTLLASHDELSEAVADNVVALGA